MRKLLNIDSNAKTVKGQKRGYMTAVLYLAPADLSGHEVCPMATAGCRAACLNTAGRAGIIKAGETTNAIQQARIAKTRWYFEDREGFMAQLYLEINAFVRRANRLGFVPCVRLNGTSDIPWERVAVSIPGCSVRHANLMEAFPTVQFYDYTKRHNRRDLPANYHLTYSLAEDNDDRALAALQNGINVAAVFKGDLPRGMRWEDADGHGALVGADADYSIPVVDGDESDLRFLDPRGVVVGLKAKGKAKQDTTGFVR